MKNIRHAIAAAILLALGTAAAAQEAAPVPTPAAPIETTTRASESADIANRIRSIFSQIEPLRGVEVRATAGVVTLSGTVPGVDNIAQAEAIASRVAGVVTVQNQLTRDLDVNTSLSPAFVQLGDDLRRLVGALPLIGAALALGVVIVLLGYGLASLGGFWRRITPNPFMAELAATFVRFVSIVVGLIAVLEILGARALLSGVLGGAGVIGIALGFAVRDTIDNYVSSLMLSLRQPFRANDHVVIEGHEGRVVRLTSRATVLMTLDGNHLRIPNAIVFKSVILNYTRNPERRFEFDLGIDTGNDPVDGMCVGLDAMKALPFVLDTPPARAVIHNVGDSSIILRFFGWVDQRQTDFLRGRSLSIQAVKIALEKKGFALPEPIYRLRFDDAAPVRLQEAVARPAPPAPRSDESGAPATLEGEDTRPDTHVKRLVEEERAEQGEDDLLDSGKPIE